MGPKEYAVILTAATTLAAGFEGLRQYAYYDPRPGDSILTVCYGTTKNIDPKKRYSVEECKKLLESDMAEAIRIVQTCHPQGLPDGVLIAFSDAVYNIGPKVACSSTASRYLKAGDYVAACNELPKWNKSNGVVLKGLTRRREAERQICLDSVQQP